MTKADLIKQIVRENPSLALKDVAKIVETSLDVLKTGLATGNHFEFRGFGTFKVYKRKGRVARNPKTGEPVTVAERPTVKFKPSRELRLLVSRDARVPNQ